MSLIGNIIWLIFGGFFAEAVVHRHGAVVGGRAARGQGAASDASSGIGRAVYRRLTRRR